MYWRRRISVVLLLLSLVQAAGALPKQWAFRIYFTDKQGSANINNPASFLSPRALSRRNRHNIAVDTTDLPVSGRYTDSVLALTGGIFHNTSRWMNTCVVLLEDSSKILQLQGRQFVKAITLVAIYDTGLHQRPAQNNKFSREESLVPGPSQFRSTGSATYYGQAYNQTAMVNGDYLHDLGLKGEGMLIAVLDAGFLFADTHAGLDSLRASGRLADQYDFLQRSSAVFDYSAHGFRVLSTMAGNMPGTYVGAAPHAQYALYRTEEEQGYDKIIEMDNFVAGTERADSLGADVITSSLGYVDFQDPAFAYTPQGDMDGRSTYVDQAAMMAVKKGILFVSSAGNEGPGGLVTPGDCDSVLSVGMVNFNGDPNPDAGYGPNAAGHVKPDVAAAGSPAYVFSDGGSGITIGIGASFATPQIAGWAACLLQGAKPGTTPYQVRNAINQSADHYLSPGVQTGYGVPNFKVASILLGVSDTTRVPQTDDFIAVWPNAFTTDLRIAINAPDNETLAFCMVDMGGRTVWRASQAVVKGRQWWHVAIPGGLPGGMYLFKAVGKSRQQVVKLVKI